MVIGFPTEAVEGLPNGYFYEELFLEIKLTYDTAKDKYYLDIYSDKKTKTVTFYGEYALEEYLRDNFDFDTEKINKLYTDMRQIKYI